MASDLETTGLYIVLGTGYAIAGYVSNVIDDDDVSFNPYLFAKTIGIGVVAGVVMGAEEMDASPESYAAAAAIAIPIVDHLVNTVISMYLAAGRDESDQ